MQVLVVSARTGSCFQINKDVIPEIRKLSKDSQFLPLCHQFNQLLSAYIRHHLGKRTWGKRRTFAKWSNFVQERLNTAIYRNYLDFQIGLSLKTELNCFHPSFYLSAPFSLTFISPGLQLLYVPR